MSSQIAQVNGVWCVVDGDGNVVRIPPTGVTDVSTLSVCNAAFLQQIVAGLPVGASVPGVSAAQLLPSGGTSGQVVAIVSNNVTWVNPSSLFIGSISIVVDGSSIGNGTWAINSDGTTNLKPTSAIADGSYQLGNKTITTVSGIITALATTTDGGGIASYTIGDKTITTVGGIITSVAQQILYNATVTPNLSNWSSSGGAALQLVGKNVFADLLTTSLTLPAASQDGTLDVSKLVNLTTLNCSGNNFAALNLNQGISMLNCSNCHLTSLVISGCTSAVSIVCSYNSLTTLNVSGLSSLAILDCSYNSLTSLDISTNPYIRSLICSNNSMASLILPTFAYVTSGALYFDASINAMAGAIPGSSTLYIDHIVSKVRMSSTGQTTYFNLQNGYLDLHGGTNATWSASLNTQVAAAISAGWTINPSTGATVTPSTKIYTGNTITPNLNNWSVVFTDGTSASGSQVFYLGTGSDSNSVYYNSSKSPSIINIEQGTNAAILDGTLNFANYATIQTIKFGMGQPGGMISAIVLTNCSALVELYGQNQSLTSIDLTNCPYLQNVVLDNNSLTSITVAGSISNLSLQSNPITALDVSSAVVVSLNCNGCSNLRSLIIGYGTVSLICSNTSLTVLNLAPSNVTLTTLVCSHCEFSSLTLSSNLTLLDCSYNPLLTALSLVPCNAAIKTINCNNCSLTTLTGLSSCSALVSLNCSNNKFTSLSVTSPTLVNLTCSYNALISLSVNNVTTTLPVLSISATGTAVTVSGTESISPSATGISRTITIMFTDAIGGEVERLNAGPADSDGNWQVSAIDLSTLVDGRISVSVISNYDDTTWSATIIKSNDAIYAPVPVVTGVLDCSFNATLTAFDLTNCAMSTVNCNNCGLIGLTIGQCPQMINCDNNSLTSLSNGSLSVSGGSLPLFSGYNLTTLNCSANAFTSLDLSSYQLQMLDCSFCSLTSITFGNSVNSVMHNLNVSYNSLSSDAVTNLLGYCIASTNISGSPTITAWNLGNFFLNTTNNPLYKTAVNRWTIDISVVIYIGATVKPDLTKITFFTPWGTTSKTLPAYVDSNNNIHLNITDPTLLQGVSGLSSSYVDQGTSYISTYKQSGNQAILGYTNLDGTFDFSDCTNLQSVTLSSTSCVGMILTGCNNLTNLDCGWCNITATNLQLPSTLGMSGGSSPAQQYATYNFDGNPLNTLPSLHSYVQSLSVNQCGLSVLNQASALTTLLCGHNSLTTLPSMANVGILDARHNSISGAISITRSSYQITLFNLSHNTGITGVTLNSAAQNVMMLDLSYTSISSLPTFVAGVIQDLRFTNTTVSTIANLSSCVALINLLCSHTGVDTSALSGLTGCTKLQYFDCNNCGGVTSLNLANCTMLVYLNCTNDALTTITLPTSLLQQSTSATDAIWANATGGPLPVYAPLLYVKLAGNSLTLGTEATLLAKLHGWSNSGQYNNYFGQTVFTGIYGPQTLGDGSIAGTVDVSGGTNVSLSGAAASSMTALFSSGWVTHNN